MFHPAVRRLHLLGSLSLAVALGWSTSASGSGVAVAQERQEESKVVRNGKVVVVNGEDHRPAMAWSLRGHRTYLGVQMVELTPELRRHFGVSEKVGILVSRVAAESPAANAGIEVGDIVTALDDEGLESPSDLAYRVARHESGESVVLEIWRGGEMRKISVLLGEREGRWVDIRQFHFPDAHMEAIEIPDIEIREAIELDAEALNQAIERLNEEMSSPEWNRHLQHFREHQSGLIEKIELLERRLEELEQRLERLGEDR